MRDYRKKPYRDLQVKVSRFYIVGSFVALASALCLSSHFRPLLTLPSVKSSGFTIHPKARLLSQSLNKVILKQTLLQRSFTVINQRKFTAI